MSFPMSRWSACLLLTIASLAVLSEGAKSKPRPKSAMRLFIDALPKDSSDIPDTEVTAKNVLGYRPVATAALSTLHDLERQFVTALGTLGAAVEDITTMWSRTQSQAVVPNLKSSISLNSGAKRKVIRPNRPRTSSGDCNNFGVFVETSISEDTCGSEADFVCRPEVNMSECENTSLALCPISNVSCSVPTVSVPLSNQQCFLFELECEGDYFNHTQISQINNLTHCSVKQIRCPSTSIVYDYSGSGAACSRSISFNGTLYHCVNVCQQNITQQQCACVMERMGPDCMAHRPFSCHFSLQAPKKVCDPPLDPRLDGEPACFTDLSVHSSVPFQYMITCEFTNTLGLQFSVDHTPQIVATLGDYEARRGNFAITHHTALYDHFVLRMKFYNFNRLGDNRATFFGNLTARQLVGIVPATIPVNFSTIHRDFFAGNRLYSETSLLNPSNDVNPSDDVLHPTFSFVPDKQFIDLHDVIIHRHVSQELSSNEVTWIVILSFGGAFLLLVLGYWINGKLNECKEHRRAIKLEKLE